MTTPTTDSQAYDYSPRHCDGFEDVLSGGGSPIASAELLARASRKGRVLLQAAGGAGKTYTMQRLADSGADLGFSVHRLDLAETPKPDLTGDRATSLLAALTPKTSPEWLSSGQPVLVLVDGLNETTRDVADCIIAASDELASRLPSLIVVISDRLNRRSVNLEDWYLASLTPVSRQGIADALGHLPNDDEVALLGSPVYLERACLYGIEGATRSAAHESELLRLGLSERQIDALALMAFHMYRLHRSRVFQPSSAVEFHVGVEYEVLLAAGMLRESSNGARFRHHLVHDFLAARAVAKKFVAWEHNSFAALSFDGSSFDGLLMAFEQVPAAGVDDFLRAVYDYSVYGTAYLLAEDLAGRRGDPGRVTWRTYTQVLLMLGERRFDRFISTALDVTDALRVAPGELSLRLLKATSLDEVRAVAKELAGVTADENLSQWLALFIDDHPDADVLRAMARDIDGVSGWTATNFLRRLGPDQPEDLLAGMATSGKQTLRWRAAYALGRASAEKGIPLLTTLLMNDEDRMVVQGAMRSLLEQALHADDTDRVKQVFTTLADSFERIAKLRLTDNLTRLLPVVDPPASWVEGASLVIQRGLMSSDTMDNQDYWRRVSAALRLGWAPRA